MIGEEEAFGLASIEASDFGDDPHLVAGVRDKLAHLLDADLGQFLGAGVNEISQSLEDLHAGFDRTLRPARFVELVGGGQRRLDVRVGVVGIGFDQFVRRRIDRLEAMAASFRMRAKSTRPMPSGNGRGGWFGVTVLDRLLRAARVALLGCLGQREAA